jgi:hypothetical protein
MRMSADRPCIAWVFLLFISISGAQADSNIPVAGASTNSTVLPKETKPASLALVETLFFSAEQRRQMDRARDRPQTLLAEGDNSVESRSTINGFVKRSDGVSTVWVDGQQKSMINGNMARRIQPSAVGMDIASITASQAPEMTTPVVRADKDKKPVVKMRRAKQRSDIGKSPKSKLP